MFTGTSGTATGIDGTEVRHAYTHAGEYQVTVTVTGLDSVTNRKSLAVTIFGRDNRHDSSQRGSCEPK